jgi:hypothetical protein
MVAVGVFALVLLGCGETTHRVGQIKAESQREPEPRSPGAAGQSSDPDKPTEPDEPDGVSTGTAGRAGSSAAPVEDAGQLPPATFDPDLGCGSQILPAVRKPLDLYLLVDNNITLTLPQSDLAPWDALLRGIESYVDEDAAAGTGVGVDYFGLACDPSAYATPTVPVDTLPDNAAAIQDSLDEVSPINLAPSRPALEGAIMYAKSRANAYPDSKQVVVFISDGYVDLFCSSSATNVSAVAAAGLAGTPSIPTYVVALDLPSLDNILSPLTRLDSLDAVARQGGTTRARRIDLEGSTQAFVESMLEVQREAESCEYSVPESVRAEPDRLSLGMIDSNGLAREVPRLAGSAQCGTGFYFDADMNWAVLCRRACDEVKESTGELFWFTDC